MRRTEFRNVLLQPATPAWHSSRIEIVIEFARGYIRSSIGLLFFTRTLAAIRDFASNEVGYRDPVSLSLDIQLAKHLPFWLNSQWHDVDYEPVNCPHRIDR